MPKKRKNRQKTKEERTLYQDEIQDEFSQNDTLNEDEIIENSEEREDSSIESAKIIELENRIKELEDKYLRANAEFENMKKRLEKEKSQAVAYANEQFARDLLTVIDALESGANSVNEDGNFSDEAVKNLKEGIDLTIDQFSKIFEKHGISLIDIENGFNPHFHEAVMRVDSEDHNEGDIVQVYQKGYLMKDRVLRPAMVTIAK